MSFFDLFRRSPPQASAPVVHAMAGETQMFYGMNDPQLLEFIRSGGDGGSAIGIKEAMRNTAVFRCVSLISYAMGMLPMHMIDSATKEKVRDHPLFGLLHRQPNDWQTAFNFRQLMQRRALVNGNAYALIVRSGGRVIRLVPLDPARVTPRQRGDWQVEYLYQQPSGGRQVLSPSDVLHVYADSDDGIVGTSMVKVAADAITLAVQTEQAQIRLFKNGMMVGGALKHPAKLSPEAYERLKASMEERLSGVENAGKWLITEEGMEANPFANTARDSQQIETRKLQVEEIGRAFGVPRPFLGIDDTSWGSGIDILGQIFVRYALNPWFSAWEQAITRSLMSDLEKDRYEVKFNAGALIRGNMKDQADFFSKALGSGGHQPWMDYEEVRETMDLPEKTIAPNPLSQKGKSNDPSQPA